MPLRLQPLHAWRLRGKYARALSGSGGTSPRAYATAQRSNQQADSIINIDDEQILRLAAKPLHTLSLADLVRHGKPPLTTSALLDSANFTLSLVPIRLAYRIQALRNLPFIVVSNSHVSKIYNNYLHSLSSLLPFRNRSIKTLEEELQFTEIMADLVQTHANTIPTLARGFLESRRYIAPETVTCFLDEHLRARIGTRLIAEQHIALHLSSQPRTTTEHKSRFTTSDPISSSQIGVIDTALRPATIIRQCEAFVGELCELRYGVRPTVEIDGQIDTTIAHIPTHVEYIITEFLKNAFRATVESGMEKEPIIITVAGTPPSLTSIDTRNEDTAGMSGVTIRIRDRGGGISPTAYPDIWAYSFTTVNDKELPATAASAPSTARQYPGNSTSDPLHSISGAGGGGSSLAGLGYGLPLGRAYAEHFGGGVQVQSLWGWGTDVYLELKGLKGV